MHAAGEFTLQDGTLIGVDINYLIDSANAFIHQQPAPSVPVSPQTPLGAFSGTVQIENGSMHSDNILLDAPAFGAKGEGDFNLLSSYIRCFLLVSLKRIDSAFPIPVLVTGELVNPSVRLDAAALTKQITSERLDNVKAKLNDKVGKLLQNFLGR